MTTSDQREVSVHSVRRDPPDLRQLGRAFLEMAVADNETEHDSGRVPRAHDADQAEDRADKPDGHAREQAGDPTGDAGQGGGSP